MIEIKDILRRLPHRYPFLLVDRIVEVEERRRVVGIKNVTINEPFFPGHFPGNPVMPGVLILEAMAQTGAVLMASNRDESSKNTYVYLAGVDRVRFRRPVVPGDQLRMELDVVSLKSRSCKMNAKATVGDARVAEAVLLSILVDLNEGGSR